MNKYLLRSNVNFSFQLMIKLTWNKRLRQYFNGRNNLFMSEMLQRKEKQSQWLVNFENFDRKYCKKDFDVDKSEFIVDVTSEWPQKYPTINLNCQLPLPGETSNHFLSSPNTFCEVREIRAGCRRVRDERPGFSIITSFNEDLLKWAMSKIKKNWFHFCSPVIICRFLQDDQQRQLKIFDIQEYDKILELAKLYSLNIARENGCILLTKTRWGHCAWLH